MKTFSAIISIGLLLTFISCKKEDITVYECTGLTPTYTTDIKPILDLKCGSSSCHDVDNPKKGLDLTNYENAKEEGVNGKLLGTIQHKSGYPNMPKGGAKLDETTIKTISCWIQNGAPE